MDKEHNRKKLAVVVMRYGEDVNGGAEQYCKMVSERLCKFHDVDVLTTKAIDHFSWKDEYENDVDMINGVTVRRFSVDRPRNIQDFNRYTGLLFDSSRRHTISDEEEWMKLHGPYSSSMLKFITDHRDDYDVFLFMTYLYAHTYFGLPLVKDKAILIPTAHDEPLIYLKLFRRLFNAPAAIFYNTSSEMRLVNSVTGNVNVYNNGGHGGIGMEMEKPVKPGRYREKYGDYIIYVGRIEEGKGCKELFDYFTQYLIESGRDIKLILVGKTSLDIPVNSRIIHVGFVDEEEKIQLLNDSLILINSSFYESLSMVLLEAFSLSVPVLVNGKCDVLKEHCIRSNAGLYYSNYSEFSAMLDFLLDNPDIRYIMGENGEKYVKENYVWDKIIDSLLILIDKVSDGNNSPNEAMDTVQINVQEIIQNIRRKNLIAELPYEFDKDTYNRFESIGLDEVYSKKKQSKIFKNMLQYYDNSENMSVIEDKGFVGFFKKIRNKVFVRMGRLVFKKQDKYNRLLLEMINEMMLERQMNSSERTRE